MEKLVLKNDGFLKTIGMLSGKNGVNSYLVGGTVRDFLLGKKNLDLDIAVEGDTSSLVKLCAKAFKGRVTAYPEFGTFILKLSNNRHIDFATARTETYSKPGALPKVRFSSLREDLHRRDFTVNAMAVSLNGKKAGMLIDYYGGKKDLEKRTLKVIHKNSFKDDPTRILRLARFAGRGYKIERNTLLLALKSAGYVKKVSFERLREELLAILKERNPCPALRLISEWGIYGYVLNGLKLSREALNLSRLKTVEERLACLLKGEDLKKVESVMLALKLRRDMKNSARELLAERKNIPALSGKDLKSMGYVPGPQYKRILDDVAGRNFNSRQKARGFVFDKYPQKR